MIRRPPRSTLSSSSAASDVYKRQFDVFARSRHLCLRLLAMSTRGTIKLRSLLNASLARLPHHNFFHLFFAYPLLFNERVWRCELSWLTRLFGLSEAMPRFAATTDTHIWLDARAPRMLAMICLRSRSATHDAVVLVRRDFRNINSLASISSALIVGRCRSIILSWSMLPPGPPLDMTITDFYVHLFLLSGRTGRRRRVLLIFLSPRL